MSRIDETSAGLAPGEVLASFALDLDGPPGLARVTLATDRTNTAAPDKAFLNDVLFEVQGATRLVALVRPFHSEVQFRVAANGAESTASVQSATPTGTSNTIKSVVIEPIRQTLPEGLEVTVARWSWRDEQITTELTTRILLSRQAVGPRLKPERQSSSGSTVNHE